MKLLITGGDCRLARAIASALSNEAQIRLVDLAFTEAPPPNTEAITGDIRQPDFAKQIVQDQEVLLHLAPIAPTSLDELGTLEHTTRGTYVLFQQATYAGIRAFVIGSTLDLFKDFPAQWDINEGWRPQPHPTLDHLCPWLGELSAFEMLRSLVFRGACLRFGTIVDSQETTILPYQDTWLHLEDAVQGVRCALERVQKTGWRGWKIFHITAKGNHAKVRLRGASEIGYQPKYDFQAEREATGTPVPSPPKAWRDVLTPKEPIPSRSLYKVVFFGAGGPVSAVAAEELASSFQLRLTDVIAIGDITTYAGRQEADAPLPRVLPPPHEAQVVDVRDPNQVMQACEGMDAIVNFTVVRPDLEKAFQVNTLGAYNILKAAVHHKIRRVVHTGPLLVGLDWDSGDRWEHDIPGDVPPRPGRHLYAHSKYLGQEMCKAFAHYYGLEIPALLYCQFLNYDLKHGINSFPVTWTDSARAVRRALEVPSLPTPFEQVHILADIPHSIFTNSRAKEILGWAPRDDMEPHWQDRNYGNTELA